MKYLIFVLALFGFVAAAQAGGNRCYHPVYGNNCSGNSFTSALPGSLLYSPPCGNASTSRYGNVLPDNYFNRSLPRSGNIPSYGTLNNCNRTETYLPSSHIINSNCDSE